jgi:hypothetical protein
VATVTSCFYKTADGVGVEILRKRTNPTPGQGGGGWETPKLKRQALD